jgi:hypothetical protein
MTAKKLKIPDLCYLADVTPMTVYNWRKGPARKTAPLPCAVDERGGVSCPPAAFRKWARDNGIELRMDPVTYLEQGGLAGLKKRPGPKPKAADAAPSKPKAIVTKAAKKAPSNKPRAAQPAQYERAYTRSKGI